MKKYISYLEQGLRLAVGKRAELPRFLIFFVTSRCNSRCQHCFFWKDINQNKNELTFDEIRELSLGLGSLSNLALSGGEPVLREDLPEICELFYRNNNVGSIHVPTNGLNPARIREVLAKILEKCKCNVSVAISLDGLEKTHDSIRGVDGNWKSVLATYNELMPLKAEYSNFKVVVNTVISNKNYGEFNSLIETVKKEMPLLDGHGFDWIRGDPKNSEFSVPSLNDIDKLTPVLKDLGRYYSARRKNFADKVELAVRHCLVDLKCETLKAKSQVVPCRAGDMFAVVYPEGDVALCELLPPIGNLRGNGIKTIWNSDKANKQREFIRDKKCFCTHGCFMPSNAILSPKTHLKVLKNLVKG